MTEAPRRTRQRDAVQAALTAAEGFRTAQELHDELRSQGHAVGLATVYRAVQALADAGEVDVLRTGDGQTSYRSCSSGHHHHLICRVCGRTVELTAPEVEAWARRMGTQHGFIEVRHELELNGRCVGC